MLAICEIPSVLCLFVHCLVQYVAPLIFIVLWNALEFLLDFCLVMKGHKLILRLSTDFGEMMRNIFIRCMVFWFASHFGRYSFKPQFYLIWTITGIIQQKVFIFGFAVSAYLPQRMLLRRLQFTHEICWMLMMNHYGLRELKASFQRVHKNLKLVITQKCSIVQCSQSGDEFLYYRLEYLLKTCLKKAHVQHNARFS